MKINYSKYFPLVKIPQEVELVIFFIQEELKSRALTNSFNAMGFDGSICSSDFSDLIFSILGFDENSDEFYGWYLDQLDSFCEDIDLSKKETIKNQAFSFYLLLVNKKKG